MNYIEKYLDHMIDILSGAKVSQHDALMKCAEIIRDTTENGGSIFTFGCSHAGLLALELYYRTGGLATINPIRAPGLNLDVDPATLTSQIERLADYGKHIIDATPIKAGDFIIIHSVSGRNTVTIDVAIQAKQKGAVIAALTNMKTTTAVPSRHPSGKNLYQLADVVIDNCGDYGDASIDVPGVPEKVGPTSTAAGAALLQAVVVQAAALITKSGRTPPVFVSANVPGGDEHNAAMLKEYGDRIFYMGH